MRDSVVYAAVSKIQTGFNFNQRRTKYTAPLLESVSILLVKYYCNTSESRSDKCLGLQSGMLKYIRRLLVLFISTHCCVVPHLQKLRTVK